MRSFIFVRTGAVGVSLSSFEPDPTWGEDAYAETVDRFRALPAEAVIRVWGGDWCGDCRRELPKLAAALVAAEFPEDQLFVYAVDEEKSGALVEEYGIEVVPTVVVEVGGAAVARFEEGAALPAPVAVANQLDERRSSR